MAKPHLDEEALAELKDVMEDEFEVLIKTYLEDSHDRIGHLKKALETQDIETFRKTAHSFKGSSMNIGAPRLGELCLAAEEAGRHERLETAGQTLEDIESEFIAVTENLKRMMS